VSDSIQELRIDITSTRTPIIRAGIGNILLFFSIVASYMLDGMLTAIQASFMYRVLCIVITWIAFVTLYLRYVSQVHITEGGELVIENPLRSMRMDLGHIQRVRIYTIPTSQTAILWINRRDKALGTFYFFVAVHTNCGPFGQTIDKLSGALGKMGILGIS
jgi:hypothetical protein